MGPWGHLVIVDHTPSQVARLAFPHKHAIEGDSTSPRTMVEISPRTYSMVTVVGLFSRLIPTSEVENSCQPRLVTSFPMWVTLPHHQHTTLSHLGGGYHASATSTVTESSCKLHRLTTTTLRQDLLPSGWHWQSLVERSTRSGQSSSHRIRNIRRHGNAVPRTIQYPGLQCCSGEASAT